MCTFDTGMWLMISRSAHRCGVTVRKHHKDGILFYFLENRVVFLILTGSGRKEKERERGGRGGKGGVGGAGSSQHM